MQWRWVTFLCIWLASLVGVLSLNQPFSLGIASPFKVFVRPVGTGINEYQRRDQVTWALPKDALTNSLTACTSSCPKLLLGALYYLEHVRSRASATRLMCSGPGPTSEFVTKTTSEKAAAVKEPPTFFGGAGQEPGTINKHTNSSFKNTMEDFLRRTDRFKVLEYGDGHCGIRSFERQRRASSLDTNVGTSMHFKNELTEKKIIQEGRHILERAINKHRVALQTLLGPFGTTQGEIQERINVHQQSALMTSCDPEFYVGGDNSIDLIAWSMYMKKKKI